MITIINIIIIALSLSMDTFALALSYGISNISKKNIIITSLVVGIFHFIMPLLGNICGNALFSYTVIKPKYILFVVFLMLSINMFLNFFEKDVKIRKLNTIGTILFAISVSIDSFSVGLGLTYIYDNILICLSTFLIISMLMTLFGFILGKIISNKLGKYAFILGSITLLIYAFSVLTN